MSASGTWSSVSLGLGAMSFEELLLLEGCWAVKAAKRGARKEEGSKGAETGAPRSAQACPRPLGPHGPRPQGPPWWWPWGP